MTNQLVITVLGGGIVAILSVALTFFFTTVSNNKNTEVAVKKAVETHKAISHQKEVGAEIEKHEDGCAARQDYFETKTALVFLVKKAGGNPQEMGLM